MNEKRRIVVNTLANGIAQFSALIASFVFMPFLIRSFGITGFGLYLLASSIVAYGTLLDLGVGASVVKMTADAAARGDREDLSSVISSALVFYLLIGIVVRPHSQYRSAS
jgi:O-antigen/teichoic acid export membrane protein